MLNYALRYASLGLSVIPLKPCGKEPLIPWQEFQKRIAGEAEIRGWFAKVPNANVGIVTGKISGICIVDLDGPEGLASAEKRGLKSSLVSLTGNGRHLWFRYSPGIPNSASKIASGIDVRSDGGFVVAPGSVHEGGKRYRWLGNPNFAELPEFPKELLKTKKLSDTSKPIVGKEEGWIAKALEDMKDGNIDITLTSILGRMHHDGLSPKDALALLRPHAEAKGATPGHLEAKIENIWTRYPSKDEMRLHKPNEQSLLLSSVSDSRLIIHSPTNPDSIQQYEQCSIQIQSGARLDTGYSKLDEMLFGGLKSSRLFTVAARTGTGKTNWLIGAARTLCEAGKRILLFSTETPYTEIWSRYKATLSETQRFEQHAFYICDSFAPNLEKVEEALREIKPDVFMFDHINHVSEGYAELGAFFQGLNFLKRKYDCAGVVTAQLNRSADWIDLKTGEKVTPRMSMIKGSGTIEQASSRVLLLSETKVLPEYTEIVGNLDKNDNGPKGLVHFGLMNKPYKMVEL